MLICSESDIKLNKSQIFNAFDELNSKLENIFDSNEAFIGCCEPVSEFFIEWHQKTFPDLCLENYPCFQYYMSEDQMKYLLEDTKTGIPLPDGYYWDEADPEKDTKLLYETWKYSGRGDYERIQ